jgi:hypothetical protein
MRKKAKNRLLARAAQTEPRPGGSGPPAAFFRILPLPLFKGCRS